MSEKVRIDNLLFYLLKRSNQNYTHVFCFKTFICFMVYLSSKLCLYL